MNTMWKRKEVLEYNLPF